LSIVLLSAVFGSGTASAEDWARHRYMEHGRCEIVTAGHSIVSDIPLIGSYVEAAQKGGSQVQACTYPYYRSPPRKDLQSGWVILANPAPDELDRWIASACRQFAKNAAQGCIKALTAHIVSQSGGQFPVIGFVAEGPGGDLCKQYGGKVLLQGLIAFEDGVTVQRKASPMSGVKQDGDRMGPYCSTDGWGSDVQKLISQTHPIEVTYAYARLAGLHSSCGRALLPDKIINGGSKREFDDAWRLAARSTHTDALATGQNRMFELQAKRFSEGVASLGAPCK
jgi:hypothetical protein